MEKLDLAEFLNALGLKELQTTLEENAIDADTLSSLTAEDLEEMEIAGNAAQKMLWGISNLIPTHEWLSKIGLKNYLTDFASNEIEFEQISSLDKDDLKEIGVSVLGHRKKILANAPTASANPSSENVSKQAQASTSKQDQSGEESESQESEETGESGISIRSPFGDGVVAEVDEMDDRETFKPKVMLDIHDALACPAKLFISRSSNLSLRVLTRPGGYVFIALDLTIYVSDWYHIRNRPLNIRVGEELLRLSYGGGNSEVFSGDCLYEYGYYQLTLAQLKSILSGGDLKMRIQGSGHYDDIIIGDDALNSWRWFYQSLFDETAFPTAVEALRAAEKAEEERLAEVARKRQEKIDKVKGFFGDMLGGAGAKGFGGLGGVTGDAGEESESDNAEPSDDGGESGVQGSEESETVQDPKQAAQQKLEEASKAASAAISNLTGNLFGGFGKKK